jgi:hypothetical protein
MLYAGLTLWQIMIIAFGGFIIILSSGFGYVYWKMKSKSSVGIGELEKHRSYSSISRRHRHRSSNPSKRYLHDDDNHFLDVVSFGDYLSPQPGHSKDHGNSSSMKSSRSPRTRTSHSLTKVTALKDADLNFSTVNPYYSTKNYEVREKKRPSSRSNHRKSNNETTPIGRMSTQNKSSSPAPGRVAARTHGRIDSESNASSAASSKDPRIAYSKAYFVSPESRTISDRGNFNHPLSVSPRRNKLNSSRSTTPASHR